MLRFLIEVPHEADKLSCAKAIKVFLESSSHFLTQCEWGCADDNHSGWMIIECPSKEDAIRVVPPAYRDQATVIELRQFSMAQIEKTIREHGE